MPCLVPMLSSTLVPRLYLGTCYIEALPHKHKAESYNKSKIGVSAFKS